MKMQKFGGASILCFGALALSLDIQAATIPVAEVAKHASKSDCWIIIEGKVYDISGYVDHHPAPLNILVDACGKDATEGWKTKGSLGKPHTRRAEGLLKTFLKGDLAK